MLQFLVQAINRLTMRAELRFGTILILINTGRWRFGVLSANMQVEVYYLLGYNAV
jgi:hypothetical protein